MSALSSQLIILKLKWDYTSLEECQIFSQGLLMALKKKIKIVKTKILFGMTNFSLRGFL